MAKAIAIAGGKIVAVGPTEQVLARTGAGAPVTDLGGRTVLPGFIDPHHHFSVAAISSASVDCRPEVAPSIEAITRRLCDAASALPPQAWLYAMGYDALRLSERRHPTRHDLDRACPDRPVLVMNASYHEGVANSLALEAAGIGRSTRSPPAGHIVRGPDGEPTGHLYEMAVSNVEKLAREDLVARESGTIRQRLTDYERRLFAAGITRIGDAAVFPSIERIYRQAHAERALRMPIVMLPISDQGMFAQPWERLDGPPTGEGSDALRVGPLKLILDGGEACAMCLSAGQVLSGALQVTRAALRDRSLDPLRTVMTQRMRRGTDGKLHGGLLYYSAEQARALADRAIDRGFHLALHAIGNEAVGMALDVIGSVRVRHGDRPPPRIEHGSIVDEHLMQRAADLGVTIVTQPRFLHDLAGGRAETLPRGLRFMPLRRFSELGATVAGSSDAPVVGFDPLDAMRSAMDRRTASGRTVHADEAVGVEEALAMYTRNAARALAVDDVTGALEPGRRADLVVLSADPVARSGFDGIVVDETWVGGECVYRRNAEGSR